MAGHVGYSAAWLVMGGALACAAPMMLRGRMQLLAAREAYYQC